MEPYKPIQVETLRGGKMTEKTLIIIGAGLAGLSTRCVDMAIYGRFSDEASGRSMMVTHSTTVP